MGPTANVIQLEHNHSSFVNKLTEAWHARNEFLFDYYLNEGVTFSSEDAEDFLMFLIRETSDDKFTPECASFWKLLFKHDVHRKLSKTGPPFIGLLIENGNLQILQILFEHPSQPNLRQTGPNADTPLHYLCNQNWHEKHDLYEKCIHWLIANDEVDIHAFNRDFQTPLDLAKTLNNEKAVEILSKIGEISTDKREILKFLFMNSVDYHSDKYPNLIEDLEGITFSQIYSCLKIVKSTEQDVKKSLLLDILNLENYVTSPRQWTILLQEACRKDFPDIVNFLLEKGADPSEVDECNDNQSAISIVEDMGNISMLAQLWEMDTCENYHKIDERIWSLRGEGGNTILHIASVKSCPKAMYRILESSGLRLMGVKNDRQELPFVPDEILETGVLKRFMDSKVIKSKIPKDKWLLVLNNRLSGSSTTRRRKICLDLNAFMHASVNEDVDFGMKNLMEISKNKIYRDYLIHPVIKILLLYRWENLRWIFFLNLAFCLLLTVCLTFNIVYTSTAKTVMFPHTRFLQGILIIFLIIRELIQGYIQGKDYFKPDQYENYFELMLIALAGYLTIADSNDTPSRHIGVFVILFTWLQLMLIIGKLPKFSVQIEMFFHVLTNFAKFLFVFSFMILAFAMTFIVLFNERNSPDANTEPSYDFNFSRFFGAIFLTFVMVGGEFDASDIPFDNYPVTSHLVFLLFVFTVAIVLLNLLNGLAVYDTQMIKQDASSYTFLARLRYLAFLDKFSRFWPKNFTRVLRKCLSPVCCFSKRERFSYLLNDEDIWRELDQIIFEQESKTLNLPTNDRIQYDDLSKLMKLQADSMEKLLNLFVELDEKVAKLDESVRLLRLSPKNRY